MKKLYFLFSLCISLFTLNTQAQFACNAGFTSSFLGQNTYWFHPTDSIAIAPSIILHSWNFGDGTAASSAINPTHSFLAPGTYTVKHRVTRVTPPNTSSACFDSATHVIIIPQPLSCNLSASFYSTSNSSNTFIKNYTNTSLGFAPTDSVRWTFYNGTTSTSAAPSFTYTAPGIYNVCLRVKKQQTAGTVPCISETCRLDTVLSVCNIQAYFTTNADSASAPATIQFTNQTIGFISTDSIRWSFGDSSPYTYTTNPTHVYSTPGIYTVCIRVKRNVANATTPACVSEFCKTIIIVNPPCNLAANFTSYRDSFPTVALNTYHFTNTSTPFATSDSIRWTFGDGTSSNQINPVHVYAQPGSYTVCLRVIKRVNGTLTNCISEKCKVVVVTQTCTINAAYTWRADSANYKNIIFTNTTVIPNPNETATWSFGDGTTASTWNATHLYAQPGRYYVCLRTQYGTCISYKCDSITIVAPIPMPTCAQLSNYTFVKNSNVVTFAPSFVASGVQYTWTFGDGTGAQGNAAVHQYTSSGSFTACLTAYKNNNCASTTCNSIQILPTINCNNITLSITDHRDTLVPNRITFTAISNTTITDQLWVITKIPFTASQTPITIHANNPTYMFLDSGYYNVCVTSTYANGCVKNTCKTIHISQNMPGTNICTLQAYPNPVTAIVNANVTLISPQLINSSIYNAQNILVAQKQQQGFVGLNTISINIANLPAGIYTIRVLYGGQVCYAPFIKQ